MIGQLNYLCILKIVQCHPLHSAGKTFAPAQFRIIPKEEWNKFVLMQLIQSIKLINITCAQCVLNTIMHVSGSTPCRLGACLFLLILVPEDIIKNPQVKPTRSYWISFLNPSVSYRCSSTMMRLILCPKLWYPQKSVKKKTKPKRNTHIAVHNYIIIKL